MKKEAKNKSSDPRLRDLRKIWGGAKTLGLDEELLHDLVFAVTKKKSIKALTATERGKVIYELQSKGAYTFKRKGRGTRDGGRGKKERRPGSGHDLITEGQQDYIHDLWLELARLIPEAGRAPWREGFVLKIIGTPWAQKKWHGQRVIEALKKRIEQERKRRGRYEKGFK